MGETVILPPSLQTDCADQVIDQRQLATALSLLAKTRDVDGNANGEAADRAKEIVAEAISAAHSIERLIADLQQRITQLERLALTDELTGLLNRRGFERELALAVAAARRYGEEGVVVYLDLDGFKAINDTFGHAAGDAALCRVSQLLAENTRLTDAVGRIGGDEFAVLLKRTNWVNGVRRARELWRLLDPAFLSFDDQVIEIRASAGFHRYHAACDGNGTTVLNQADTAMYERKRARCERAEARRIA